MRKMLEHRNITDEERMDQLEANLKEAKLMAEDADRKYDEVKTVSCSEFYTQRSSSRQTAGLTELNSECGSHVYVTMCGFVLYYSL